MNEEIKKFSKEKISQAMQCETIEELMTFAEKEGINLTEEQAKEFLAETSDAELNEDLLEKVAGGYESSGCREFQPCFITTAVCECYGLPDDCEELTTLRAYRDNWLKKQPDGEALISEYYAIAPGIVQRIKSSADCETYCRELMEKYIRPCIALIEQEKFVECKELYIKMVGRAKEMGAEVKMVA